MPRFIDAIRTPRRLLRAWRDEDMPAYAALDADPRVMEHVERAHRSRSRSATSVSRRSSP